MAPAVQQPFDGRAADLEMFGVHRVAAGVVVLDGKEGAGSDVERHLFELDACGVLKSRNM